MKDSYRKILFWILAVIITIGSAIYQRMTGPTYPVSGSLLLDGSEISYALLRSETVGTDAPVILSAPDTSLTAEIVFRRYKSNDAWTKADLERRQERLVFHLPSQPAAGKIIYKVFVKHAGQKTSLSGDEWIILRYKGAVPVAVLIPHVLLMFLAMLWSNRAGVESLTRSGNPKKYIPWVIGFFFLGGFILGPLVQKYAFDALWTGIPFGTDLTDNKTLIAMIGWLVAWYKNRGEKRNRNWILFAAVLMLAVYLIPHSLLGSELDYTKMNDLPSGS